MEAEAVTKKPVTAKISEALWSSSSWAFETAMLPLSMILVQVLTMVTLLICKLALNAGMRPFVFLVYYCNLIAAATVERPSSSKGPYATFFYCVRAFELFYLLAVASMLSLSILLWVINDYVRVVNLTQLCNGLLF